MNIILATADYGAIGTALAIAFIAIMQVYQSWKAKEKERILNEIHTLTNGSMGFQKRILAETTAAKAAITKDSKDIQAAETALADYQEHQKTESKIEKQRTGT